MDEKKMKLFENCKEFTKKHGPEILLGLAVCALPLTSMYSWRPKEKEQVEHESVPRQVEAVKQYKMKVTEEQRKYANWMTYEKEKAIYDAYSEFKSTEDFG